MFLSQASQPRSLSPPAGRGTGEGQTRADRLRGYSEPGDDGLIERTNVFSNLRASQTERHGGRDDFESALKAGAALLWVRCDDPELEIRATRILEESGGRFVHIHGRPAAPEARAG